MNLGYAQKNLTVSLLIIAAGASMASAQRDINTFVADLLEDGVVVEVQHAAPEFNHFNAPAGQIIDMTTPLHVQLFVAENNTRFGGFDAIVNDTADNTGSNQGVGMADAITKDAFTVVPLPSAAFAGLGLMCGLAGVRYMRSRR